MDGSCVYLLGSPRLGQSIVCLMDGSGDVGMIRTCAPRGNSLGMRRNVLDAVSLEVWKEAPKRRPTDHLQERKSKSEKVGTRSPARAKKLPLNYFLTVSTFHVRHVSLPTLVQKICAILDSLHGVL